MTCPWALPQHAAGGEARWAGGLRAAGPYGGCTYSGVLRVRGCSIPFVICYGNTNAFAQGYIGSAVRCHERQASKGFLDFFYISEIKTLKERNMLTWKKPL